MGDDTDVPDNKHIILKITIFPANLKTSNNNNASNACHHTEVEDGLFVGV